jgi:type II secretory pathway pseudopilin PulG
MIVAAFVVSVVAVLASGGALWYARRQTDEAARSRVAAEISANAAVSAAKAAARQLELAEAEAAKYVPPWTLRWDVGDTYVLANDGESTEYGVTLSAADELIARMPDAGQEVDPRSGITFVVASRSWLHGTWARETTRSP